MKMVCVPEDFYRGFWLTEPCGNNAFSFKERSCRKIFVPPLIQGTVKDVALGEEIAFCEIVDGKEVAAKGLRSFVHIERPGQDIFIFDNHNHAFFFWSWAVLAGKVPPGLALVHVDQHKDMREPGNQIPLEAGGWKPKDGPAAKLLDARSWRSVDGPTALGPDSSSFQPLAFSDHMLRSIFNYTNFELNVGNFIPPALRLGLVSQVIHVDSAASFKGPFPEQLILDIDLDIFAPLMSYIPDALKVARLIELIPRSPIVTIASSPFFIDQSRAISALRDIVT